MFADDKVLQHKNRNRQHHPVRRPGPPTVVVEHLAAEV